MMKLVCVLDLDETLGYFDEFSFNVRPNVDFLINFLKVIGFDIILWSYGTDDYVESIMNGFFSTTLCRIAYKIYGRTLCKKSMQKYHIFKHSNLIRELYSENILIVGIDDRANEMMDEDYDFRITVEPYDLKNSKDDELIKVIRKIVLFISSLC